MVEEVRNQLKEMLESGAIRPSQSAWCNAMVLVQKKDSGLHFCINFCHLNACTKKDSYPLPRIQEALESPVGAGHFSCLDLKSRFWQIKIEEMSKQYTAFVKLQIWCIGIEWLLDVCSLMFVPRQFRFSLYSGAVITEGRCSSIHSLL